MKAPYIAARRWLFFGLVGATTLLGSLMMFDIVRAGVVTWPEIGIIGLFMPTFGWISLTLWNAVVGFTFQILDLDPVSLRRSGMRACSDTPISSNVYKNNSFIDNCIRNNNFIKINKFIISF